jgi:TolB-like protein
MTRKKPITRFWQELKHRKVLRSLAIYAGTAFIILEASTIIFPLWELPEWSIRLVLWILILGGFINVIIAWFYDITPDGMQRTKPMEELPTETRTPDSRGWKAATYISLVVIVGLIMFNLLGSKGKVRAGEIQSMVILPFGNLTGDDQLNHLVSSMHSMLITDIGRIGALRVKGKTTSDKYADSGMSASEIAKEQNVEAVLETDVLCLGTDSVCIVFRLLSTLKEEEQLWMYEYREHKSQFLNMYNIVTRQVAAEAMIELSPDEERLLSRSRAIRRETFDNYLMGNYYLGDASKDALFKAREYLNRAVESDPDWAPLYAGLANVWTTLAQMGFEPTESAFPIIYDNLDKALELDPDNAYTLSVKAPITFLVEWDWEKAEMEYLKALANNPNDAFTRVVYAQLLTCLQRPAEALAQGQLAMELDPENALLKVLYTQVLMSVGDFQAALDLGIQVVADSGSFIAYNSIINSAYYCGDFKKVMEAAKHILPVVGVNFKEVEIIYDEIGFVPAYEEALRNLEVLSQTRYIAPTIMAGGYMMVDQPDKALEWLEKGYEVHSQVMPYIATVGFLFEPLFDHPRFIAILEKMNLPLPKTD